MLLYCLKCREKADSKNPRFAKTNKGKLLFSSKYAVCDSQKLRFIKEQEASGLLTMLGIKTPLSKIPLVCPLLF